MTRRPIPADRLRPIDPEKLITPGMIPPAPRPADRPEK